VNFYSYSLHYGYQGTCIKPTDISYVKS